MPGYWASSAVWIEGWRAAYGAARAGALSCALRQAAALTIVWRRSGRVAEWLKAAVLKTAERASVPWVRIPPRPFQVRVSDPTLLWSKPALGAPREAIPDSASCGSRCPADTLLAFVGGSH